MKLIPKTRSILALILAVALLFAAGCSAKTPEVPSSGGETSASEQSMQGSSAPESGSSQQSGEPQSESSAESESNIESESEPDSSSSQPAAERRLAAGVEKIEGAETLYDLTALIPRYENMTLADFAMQDQNRLLLLYQVTTNFGERAPGFTLALLDLETGAVDVLRDRQPLNVPDSVPVDYYVPTLACADPPIVAESVTSNLYFYPDESVQRIFGEKEHFSKIFSVDDRLYVLTTQGNLYSVKKESDPDSGAGDKNDVAYGVLWNSGISFERPELWEISDTSAVFRVNPLADEKTDSVYLSVSLEDGALNGAYTAEENNDNYHIVSKNRVVTRQQQANGDWALAVIENSETKYVSDFPKAGMLASFAENGWVTVGQGADGSLCFILRYDGEEKTFLWDYGREEAKQADLPVKKQYDVSALPQDADAFAQSLEQRFGVTISLREEALEGWNIGGDYSIEPENDEKTIFETLSEIQTAFSNYPEGFFRQLGSNPLRLGIAAQMTGIAAETVSQANGLCIDGDPGGILFRSAPGVYTIYHEMGHTIFNKICHEGFYNDMMGNFNELNPRDFTYSFSYDADDPDSFKYTPYSEDPGENYENVYFSSDYAKISNTEDVAELMGHLMRDDLPQDSFKGPHMREKCEFLFERIRDSFDTDGWPEETYWERRLAEAAQN